MKIEESKHYVPLGVVFLKQFLERERGIKCSTIFTFNDDSKPEFERYVKEAKILLLSTSLMLQWRFPESIAQFAKKINPSITVIAGGMAVFK